MSLDNLKVYLKADGTSDDVLIEGLQLAAEEYLANAGVIKNYDQELYCLAVKLLVSHWYYNRIVQTDKSLTKLSFSLDAIIMQLK